MTSLGLLRALFIHSVWRTLPGYRSALPPHLHPVLWDTRQAAVVNATGNPGAEGSLRLTSTQIDYLESSRGSDTVAPPFDGNGRRGSRTPPRSPPGPFRRRTEKRAHDDLARIWLEVLSIARLESIDRASEILLSEHD